MELVLPWAKVSGGIAEIWLFFKDNDKNTPDGKLNTPGVKVVIRLLLNPTPPYLAEGKLKAHEGTVLI